MVASYRIAKRANREVVTKVPLSSLSDVLVPGGISTVILFSVAALAGHLCIINACLEMASKAFDTPLLSCHATLCWSTVCCAGDFASSLHSNGSSRTEDIVERGVSLNVGRTQAVRYVLKSLRRALQ